MRLSLWPYWALSGYVAGRSAAWGIFILVSLCACTTHRNQWRDVVNTPSNWKASTFNGSLDAASLRTWWKRFDDSVLDVLIEKALAGSPDIKSALSRIAESRGERSVQISDLLPTVTGNISDQIQRRDEQSTGLVTRSETFNLSADMNWEIDLFGKQLQNVKAATKDVEKTIENYYAAQVTLCGDVASAYFTLRGAEKQLDVVRRNVATRDETTQMTRWKQEAGISDTLELQQAVSTLEQARASIPSIEKTIAQTKNQLAVLCGESPGALDRVLARSDSLPQVPGKLAVGVPVEALNNRPDVRAAIDAVQAAYHRKTAAQLERLPTIDLSGSFGLEALRTGTIFSPEAAARTLAGSLMASLAQPIFEGGRITANIRINDEKAKQAVFAYEDTVLTALSEVEDAFVSIRQSTERLKVLRQANRAASEASDLATQQYKGGAVDILTVLDVQRTQLSVEEERANTEVEQLNAYVQLYKALGGGWKRL